LRKTEYFKLIFLRDISHFFCAISEPIGENCPTSDLSLVGYFASSRSKNWHPQLREQKQHQKFIKIKNEEIPLFQFIGSIAKYSKGNGE